MKKHQCIRSERCIKCELWYEISLFFSKQKDIIIVKKQKEIIIRLEKFFDTSDCSAACWSLCFNDNCKEYKLWKDVHNQLKTYGLS